MTARKRKLSILTAVVVLCTVVPTDTPRAQEIGAEYLRRVRAYADALLTHGRDTRGDTHSPLIATTLDRKTFGMIDEDLPEIDGVPEENRVPQGANPMHDQNLYQILYVLSTLTGNKAYARSADEILEWFLVHCQNPVTDLLAWGDHMGWDFETEQPIRKKAGTLHAFFRPWVLWDRCYQLAPVQSLRFAKGLWNYQIGDHETGNFARRAVYDQFGPSINSDYPDHGGYYVATWATAVHELKNPRYLSDLATWPIAIEESRDGIFTNAIQTVSGYLDSRRSPETGALTRDSATPINIDPYRGRVVNPARNLSMAIDLWNAAEAVDGGLAEGLRGAASRTDTVFLALRHDPAGQGFLTGVSRNTLRPYGEEKGQYSTMWVAGVDRWTTAQVGVLCATRYRQTGEDRYRDLALAAANAYMKGAPVVTEVGYPSTITRLWRWVSGHVEPAVHPRTVGEAMHLMVHAYLFTRDGTYLLRAERLAEFGVRVFLDGESPLPRATHLHDHYEAVTGGDTFMLAMLEMYAIRNGRLDEMTFVWCDR